MKGAVFLKCSPGLPKYFESIKQRGETEKLGTGLKNKKVEG